ncbi:hypothetical protein C8F01DRAFT_1138431 [Mycena amicta]|nr:hypothetical protein C8F01DRAFT_1138431 [Mycena amicta]
MSVCVQGHRARIPWRVRLSCISHCIRHRPEVSRLRGIRVGVSTVGIPSCSRRSSFSYKSCSLRGVESLTRVSHYAKCLLSADSSLVSSLRSNRVAARRIAVENRFDATQYGAADVLAHAMDRLRCSLDLAPQAGVVVRGGRSRSHFVFGACSRNVSPYIPYDRGLPSVTVISHAALWSRRPTQLSLRRPAGIQPARESGMLRHVYPRLEF